MNLALVFFLLLLNSTLNLSYFFTPISLNRQLSTLCSGAIKLGIISLSTIGKIIHFLDEQSFFLSGNVNETIEVGF